MTQRAANLVKDMRVITPTGAVAKVQGIQLTTGEEIHTRVRLLFLDPERESEPLQAKLLKPYMGPPVVFPDEAERIHRLYDDAKAAE